MTFFVFLSLVLTFENNKLWNNNFVFEFLFSVDDGAIIDAVFDSFRHSLPSGFDRIMVEKALL